MDWSTGWKVNLEGLPERYRAMEPAFEKYMLVVSWQKDRKSLGTWSPKHKAIAIYPLAVKWFARWPRNDADDLPILLDTISELLDHELRHMMQDLFIASRDARQVEIKPDYGNHGDAYYTSQVEFDPTIASEAAEFVRHYRLLVSMKKKVQLGDAIRKTVGMMKADIFDGFAASAFFKALRRTKDPRYNLAVKKFLAEVQKLLAS